MDAKRIQIVLFRGDDEIGQMTEEFLQGSGLTIDVFRDPSREGMPLLRVINGVASANYEGFHVICRMVNRQEVRESQGRSLLGAIA